MLRLSFSVLFNPPAVVLAIFIIAGCGHLPDSTDSSVKVALVVADVDVKAIPAQVVVPPQQSFMLGKTNINAARIRYKNPQTGTSLTVEQTRLLVAKLLATQPLNQNEIHSLQGLVKGDHHGEGFVVNNPYYPDHQADAQLLPKPRSIVKDGIEVANPEGYDDPRIGYTVDDSNQLQFYQQEPVTRWLADISHAKPRSQQVCALKFSDGQERYYLLRTFPNLNAAKVAGWVVTHQHQCGTCSTLQDLAAYISVPNQATPVAACSRQTANDFSSLGAVKQCIIETVGFTEMCAETWAYNAVHTATICRQECLSSQGQPAVIDEANGKMNRCLWCDERVSGPGFKYSAGRTRRGSGLDSAIASPNDVLFYEADHSRYFLDD